MTAEIGGKLKARRMEAKILLLRVEFILRHFVPPPSHTHIACAQGGQLSKQKIVADSLTPSAGMNGCRNEE